METGSLSGSQGAVPIERRSERANAENRACPGRAKASIANLRLQGRNPNAGHVSFWEGEKSEGKFRKVVQRSPTVPTAGDKGDLGSGNRLTADGVAKLPADEDHTGD